MAEPGRQAPPEAVRGGPWLLLIHQIPPKPDYLRVKIGRRLQRVGAVAIKNSVYVLPRSAETQEDFQWIVREIREGGGDALIAEAAFVEGLSDREIEALFAAARDEEYAALLRDGKPLLRTLSARKSRPAARRRQLEQEAAKLRRRFDTVTAIDFFGAPKRALAQALLSDLQRQLASSKEGTAADATKAGAGGFRGRIWVTRRGVHVDRIASAWLIRRFIDPEARFRFVDPQALMHRDGELRFDMFEAEFTHVGDACTFETLAVRFVPGDKSVREIGEIVHDVDCKDGKFQREEAAGLRRMIAGIAAAHAGDDARLDRGAALFDDLYAAFAAAGGDGE
ncbi:MAG TPA: chromate resistance protein ChrB domain-containing protein [Gemmatimonadaceae bacterium]